MGKTMLVSIKKENVFVRDHYRAASNWESADMVGEISISVPKTLWTWKRCEVAQSTLAMEDSL